MATPFPCCDDQRSSAAVFFIDTLLSAALHASPVSSMARSRIPKHSCYHRRSCLSASVSTVERCRTAAAPPASGRCAPRQLRFEEALVCAGTQWPWFMTLCIASSAPAGVASSDGPARPDYDRKPRHSSSTCSRVVQRSNFRSGPLASLHKTGDTPEARLIGWLGRL